MGVFSWITLDTNQSIPATGNTADIDTFTVYMKDNKGNVWREDAYEGYGIFGGKDYYELLAEMNGGGDRYKGIDIAFSGKSGINWPNLVSYKDTPYENIVNQMCGYQGYFYPQQFNDEYEDEYRY